MEFYNRKGLLVMWMVRIMDFYGFFLNNSILKSSMKAMTRIAPWHFGHVSGLTSLALLNRAPLGKFNGVYFLNQPSRGG